MIAPDGWDGVCGVFEHRYAYFTGKSTVVCDSRGGEVGGVDRAGPRVKGSLRLEIGGAPPFGFGYRVTDVVSLADSADS